MKSQAKQRNKNTSLNLSSQVRRILADCGLSKVFNYNDYKHFKVKASKSFNKAQAIADFFIEENQNNSDLNEYIF